MAALDAAARPAVTASAGPQAEGVIVEGPRRWHLTLLDVAGKTDAGGSLQPYNGQGGFQCDRNRWVRVTVATRRLQRRNALLSAN